MVVANIQMRTLKAGIEGGFHVNSSFDEIVTKSQLTNNYTIETTK